MRRSRIALAVVLVGAAALGVHGIATWERPGLALAREDAPWALVEIQLAVWLAFVAITSAMPWRAGVVVLVASVIVLPTAGGFHGGAAAAKSMKWLALTFLIYPVAGVMLAATAWSMRRGDTGPWATTVWRAYAALSAAAILGGLVALLVTWAQPTPRVNYVPSTLRPAEAPLP